MGAMREFQRHETLMFQAVPPDADALQVIYAYPNTYTVGITSLGYQLVWSFFAMNARTQVSRLFTDAHEPLPPNPALLGFSFSWELDYTNVMGLLEKHHIPIRASERSDNMPLVFGGGPVLTANPEPYAEFFDVVLLGDGETLLNDFVEAVRAASGGSMGSVPRRELLKALSQVPGIYVPCMYTVTYSSPEGEITKVAPIEDGVPPTVQKQTYKGGTLATSMVVSPMMAWENIYMTEVVRSCPEMCRFCLASYLTLPFRAAPVEGALIPSLKRGLEVTDRIGLLGASVTQHPEFEQLLDFMMLEENKHVRMSIASVRTGTVTRKLAESLAARGTRSLTVAVESGSPRVRKIVNKKLDQDEILAAAANAQEGGLEALKLYGMVGIPGECNEDVEATIQMFKDIKKVAPRLRLTYGCSTFVPKAHTPFQWYGVSKEGEKRLNMLQKGLRPMGVEFRPESYKWSLVQAMLSRGDRRLADVLISARDYGDSLGSFRRAFKDHKGSVPKIDHYVYTNMEPSPKALPWQHLQGPLPVETLIVHAAEAAVYMEEPVDEGDRTMPETSTIAGVSR